MADEQRTYFVFDVPEPQPFLMLQVDEQTRYFPQELGIRDDQFPALAEALGWNGPALDTWPRVHTEVPVYLQPAGAEITILRMTPGDAEERRRRVNGGVAEPMPISLLSLEDLRPAPTPNAAGASWGIQAIGADVSKYTGKGVTVAVLDTGIEETHPAFKGLNLTVMDFTGTGPGDGVGHGTHCAATIAGRDVNGYRIGVAQGIDRLLVGKVIGPDSTTQTLVEGIKWAVEAGAHVISMSTRIDFPAWVASRIAEGIPTQKAVSDALVAYRNNIDLFDKVAGYARTGGLTGRECILVAAGGNESERDFFTMPVAPPAASRDVISVAAVQQTAGGGVSVAPFSNVGAKVAAPGVDVLSAGPRGAYYEGSGTSMAAPHVAGVAALYAEMLLAQEGAMDPDVLAARLVGTAVQGGLSQTDGGTGLIKAP
jgi:subtilisin family serine protease